MRASAAALLGAAVIAVGGLLYLTLTHNTEDVYVAAHDLPAYHQIVEDDIRLSPLPSGSLPNDSVRERDVVLGRYTLATVRQDRPFQRSGLGPKLAIGSLDAPLLALKADAETTMGGRMALGDRVDVLFSALNVSVPQATRRLTNVLVVDIVDGSNGAVIVAVNPSQEDDLAAARGASTVLFVRIRPSAGS